MDEETAVGNGVCSYGSPAYRVGTYMYDASCCNFMYIDIDSLSSSWLQKECLQCNALYVLYIGTCKVAQSCSPGAGCSDNCIYLPSHGSFQVSIIIQMQFVALNSQGKHNKWILFCHLVGDTGYV